jgi:uncharacterized zinc-type alcohol dehydrogenase-like protein
MTKALLLNSPTAKFERGEIQRRALRADDVRLEIQYSGICHSDIHQGREEWFESIFPMVPGHEMVGIVTEVGSDVTKFKVGDRAGVGVFIDSCGTCDFCASGYDQYCSTGRIEAYNAKDYEGNVTYGGYSNEIVAKESFTQRVPTNLEISATAPLLCAGITVYSPLRHWQAGPGKKVAVIGLGGLGHMAVKFAHAMGADVTVIGMSESKKADALRMGAKDYVIGTEENLENLKLNFDLIINASSASLDIDLVLSTLTVDGTLVYVGLPPEDQKFSPFSVADKRRSIAGSNTGSMAETQEMLDFCGEHGIVSDVEIVTADEVDEAWDRVVASDVRYRFVIDTSTI